MTSEVGRTTTVTTTYPIPGSPDKTRRLVDKYIQTSGAQQASAIARQFDVKRPCSHDSIPLRAAAIAYLYHIGKGYNATHSVVEQVASHLQNQLEARRKVHLALPNKELQTLLPKGITHTLIQEFAKMLYPGSWHPAGRELVRTLLISYKLEFYLQEEHVAQLLALLQHDLSEPLSHVTTVHPSMELLVRATLNLNDAVPLAPHLICQALLSTLLSCTRQKHKEPNCYVVACIPYLIGNHPKKLLEHLYSLLSNGYLLLRGHRIELTSWLPMFELESGWKTLPAIPPSEILSSTTIQDVLTALGISVTSPSDLLKQPLNLFEELTAAQRSPDLYKRLCLHLQGFKGNLLVQLLTLTTEFWFMNTNCSHTPRVFEKISDKLRRCLTHLPPHVRSQCIERTLSSVFIMSPSEEYLASHMPNLTGLDPRVSRDYRTSHMLSARFCVLEHGHLLIIPSFSELITVLDTLLTNQLRVYYNQHPHLECSSVAARSLRHTTTPHELAVNFTALFLDLSASQKRELGDISSQLDSCILPKAGGSSATVIEFIASGCNKAVIVQSRGDAEDVAQLLNRSITINATGHLPPYLIMKFNGHSFIIYLTPTHPLALTPSQLNSTLQDLKETGRRFLSRSIDFDRLAALVHACYPYQQDIDVIMARLRPTRISTIREAIRALLHVVDPIDKERVSRACNCYLSNYASSAIPFEALLEYLGISMDPKTIQRQFKYETATLAQHPYHICYILRHILISNGHHISIAAIKEALYQVARIRPYLDIGNLNYMDSDETGYRENPEHIHLLLDFDFVQEELAFFHAGAKTISLQRYQQGSLTLIFPKGSSSSLTRTLSHLRV